MKNSTVKYKGYVAQVTFDAVDEIFVGRIINADVTISFHVDAASEVKAAMAAEIDDYLESCADDGQAVAEPKVIAMA